MVQSVSPASTMCQHGAAAMSCAQHTPSTPGHGLLMYGDLSSVARNLVQAGHKGAGVRAGSQEDSCPGFPNGSARGGPVPSAAGLSNGVTVALWVSSGSTGS